MSFKLELDVPNRNELMRLLETFFKVPRAMSPYVALDMMCGVTTVKNGFLVTPLDHMPYSRYECGVWFHATGYEYWDADRQRWEIQYEDDLLPEQEFDTMIDDLLAIAPNWTGNKIEESEEDNSNAENEVDLFPELEVDLEF